MRSRQMRSWCVGPRTVAVLLVVSPALFAQSAPPPREVLVAPPQPIAHASFGFSSAVADTDGDGFLDLGVSAYREKVNGVDYAGRIYTLMGPNLRPGVDVPQPPPTETARFGYSMAFGDVNGDGFPDLVATARKGHPNGVWQAGRVFVHYGPDYQTWTELVEPVLETNSAFGYDVFAGDVNGDGYADVAIGTRLGDWAGLKDSGEVYVFLGPTLQTYLHVTEPVPEAHASFGIALAITDFDGDGFGDLFVGTNGAVVNGQPAAGEVHVFKGPNLTWFTSIPNPNPGMNEIFGYHVVAGDMDVDGFPDLQVGAPYDTVSGLSQAGSVHGYRSPSFQPMFSLTEPVVQAQSNFGRALAVGDVDADGADDLLVATTYADFPGAQNAGEAWLFFGPTLQSFVELGADAPEPGAELGTGSIGDLDHDGYGDVFIGARLGDWQGLTNAGWGLYYDFATAQPFVPYGYATAGSGALEPTLTGSGTLSLGTQAALSVGQALGGASAALLWSEKPGLFALDGALVEVGSPQVVPLVLSGTPGQRGGGTVTVPFLVPNDPALVGEMLFLQALVADAGAATGSVAATRGLKMTFRP